MLTRMAEPAAAAIPAAGTAALSLPRITVPQSRMTPYLRAWVEVSDGVLRWQVPRALLGVVPIGTRHIEIPLEAVRSVRVLRAPAMLGRFLAALVVAVVLLIAFGWIAVPFVLVGVWLVLVSNRPHLEVETFDGRRQRAAFCLDAQIDAELYAISVNELADEARRGV
jgi:hypothetical protein